jgi:hypothetical protein
MKMFRILNKVIKYNSVKKVKPTKAELENTIKLFGNIQQQLYNSEDELNDSEKTFELIQLFEIYKTPLLFAWEKFNYGFHTDFWKEGDSMATYFNFAVRPREILDSIIQVWKSEPPSSFLGKDADTLSKRIINIYEILLEELKTVNSPR